MAKCTKAMVIWPPSGREGDHRRWWKEPASIESNVFVKNGCIISRWLLQSRFARQLPPGGSPLFRSRVFFIKLYLCKIATAIFEIDFVSKLTPPQRRFPITFSIAAACPADGRRCSSLFVWPRRRRPPAPKGTGKQRIPIPRRHRRPNHCSAEEWQSVNLRPG